MATSVSGWRSSTLLRVSGSKVDINVNSSHLSLLLFACTACVLLTPVCAVVNVRSEHISQLTVATLAFLTQEVSGLEVCSERLIVIVVFRCHAVSLTQVTEEMLFAKMS